jgi:TatD DNase family protein
LATNLPEKGVENRPFQFYHQTGGNYSLGSIRPFRRKLPKSFVKGLRLIIDTHIHLDDSSYREDLESVLERGTQAGVTACIIPGADIDDLPRAVALCEAHDTLYFAAGVHPYHAGQFDAVLLASYLTHPKCVAVGECGLDYYRLPETDEAVFLEKQRQKEVFAGHIELAITYDLPLIVHVRDASADSHAMLKAYEARGIRGVLHCFNASELLLDLSETFYYGIGGVLTFKNARKLLDVLPKIPIERLLIETDAPYLTPHPHRGERNEPAYTRLVVQKISQLLEMSEAKVEMQTTANAKALFRRLKAG